MKIYLDDERKAPWGWTKLTTAEEVIELLKEGKITELSLDHDLGTEKTGYDVLLWIENQIHTVGNGWFVPNSIELHTANPVGMQRMQQALDAIYQKLHSLDYEQT